MIDDMIRALRDIADGIEISCSDCHRIAGEAGMTPLELARVVNRDTELRFYRCQLGLFGYGPKAEGKNKIVLPAQWVPGQVEEAIRMVTVDGRVSCKAAWEIAEAFGYPRLGISNAIEALGLKVKPCQLGSF